jgi:hypothetical protein
MSRHTATWLARSESAQVAAFPIFFLLSFLLHNHVSLFSNRIDALFNWFATLPWPWGVLAALTYVVTAYFALPGIIVGYLFWSAEGVKQRSCADGRGGGYAGGRRSGRRTP